MFDKNLEEDTTKANDNELDAELLAMVGENKKYGSVEAALKSIKPAQDHIAVLEAEARQLRERLKELEDKTYADQVKAALKDEDSQPAAVTNTNTEVDINTLVKNSVNKVLSQAEAERQAKSKQKVVIDAAIKNWGADAESNLYSKALELGLSSNQINELSATSPEAALKLLGLEPAKPLSQYADIKPTVRTTTKQTPKEKPVKPNWGNDNELVKYIRDLDAYLAEQEKK